MQLQIGLKERLYIDELSKEAHLMAVDCVIDERYDRVIYLIRKGEMGLAIGRGGAVIRKLQKSLGKRVEMIEEESDLKTFIENLLKPAHVSAVKIDETTGIVSAFVSNKADLAIAIGHNGCGIEKVRLLVLRYFKIEFGEISLI